MSVNYTSNSEALGGPLNYQVREQLRLRKEIVSKDRGRTDEELKWMNSQNIFVRMISSVDRWKYNGSKGYSSEMAEDNILLGGTLANGTLTGGILNGEQTAYELDPNLGYRPKAGITNFSVQPKNLYGTLRTATVEFVVQSREQFDKIEQLFLRPGFSVLLEWGHSFYATVDDKGVREFYSTPSLYEKFISNTHQGNRYITRQIENLKKDSQYNYDGMHAIIKNFSWSFLETGGYACQVELISFGEILESLQVGISSNNEGPVTKEARSKASKEEEVKKLAELLDKRAHYLLKELICLNELDIDTIRTVEEIKSFSAKLPSLNLEVNKGATVEQKYIKLRQLLKYVNNSYMLKDGGGKNITQFYTGARDEFVTFSDHHSYDPYKFVLPKVQKENRFPFEVRIPDIGTGQDVKESEVDNILDIWVNVSYLIDRLTSIIDEVDTNSKSIFDFLKDLCKVLNKCLGDINQFDIVFDDTTQLHHIVDRRTVPDRRNLPELTLFGKGSIAENVSLNTKLTNAITTMLAISAQAGRTDAGFEMLNLHQWHKGLRDRQLPIKKVEPSQESDSNTEEGKEYKNINELKTTYNNFILRVNNQTNAYPSTEEVETYTRDDINSFYVIHKTLMQSTLSKILKGKSGQKPGLIPFELSFTIRGISGIKIGQGFTIEDTVMLPERYRDNVGFLVTGVTHKSQSNRWVTEVKSQMIVL